MRHISIIIILIFLTITVQFIISNLKLLKFPAYDFEVFYLAGKQVLKHGNPYLKLGKDIVRNPPPTILVFSLLSFLPILISQLIWFIFSLGSFFVASFFLFKTLKINGWQIWLSFLSAVFLFFPFRYNLGSGQVSNILLLLIILAFYWTQKNKIFHSALSLSLAIALKVTPLFFLITLFFQRRIKQIFWILVILTTLFLITGIFLTFDIYKYYFSISNSYIDFANSVYYNQSLAALIFRLTRDSQSTQLIALCILFIFISIFIFFLTRIKQQFLSDILVWNISILYILIFAPFTWQHHFVIIIFPLLTTAYVLFKNKNSYIFYLLLLISYLMTGGNIKNPHNFQNLILGPLILSHVVLGAILLLILNFVLLKKLLR